MTLETLQAVTAELVRRGLTATLEYPGAIYIKLPGLSMVAGDANDTFAVDFCDPTTDDTLASTTSDIPSDSDDVTRLADFLVTAYADAKEFADDKFIAEAEKEYDRIIERTQ